MLLRPGWWFHTQPNTLLRVHHGNLASAGSLIWSASGYILVNHWIHNSSRPLSNIFARQNSSHLSSYKQRQFSARQTTHVHSSRSHVQTYLLLPPQHLGQRSKSVTLPWHGNRLLHTTLKMVAGRVETMERVKGKVGPKPSGQSILCRV